MRANATRWTVLGLLLLGLLAACGDDPEPTAESDEAEASEDASDGEAAGDDTGGDGDSGDDAEADAADDAEAEEGDDADEAVADDADAFLESLEAVPAQITYEGEEGGDTFEMTFAFDPPSSAFEILDEESETRMILAEGEQPIMCSDEGSGWECMRFPAAEDAEEDALGMFGMVVMSPAMEEMREAFDVEWDRAGSDTVAGRTAECLEVPFVEDIDGRREGRTTVCVDTELGVWLSSVTESADGVISRYEAIEVSETPDPDLFEPPAEPMDLDFDFGG